MESCARQPGVDPSAQLLWVWQWLDSGFPAGGFAHSGGLEAAWQAGELEGPDALRAFLRASLRQASRGSLPFVLAGWDRREPLAAIDARCDAFLSNHIANRASRRRGQALIRSAAGVFDHPSLPRLLDPVLREATPGHLPPLFGSISRAIGLTRGETASGWGYTGLRETISSAVRLGIVGPMQGQRLQREVAAPAAAYASAPPAATFMQESLHPDAVQTAPLLDLLAGTQDRLYSKLFQS